MLMLRRACVRARVIVACVRAVRVRAGGIGVRACVRAGACVRVCMGVGVCVGVGVG